MWVTHFDKPSVCVHLRCSSEKAFCGCDSTRLQIKTAWIFEDMMYAIIAEHTLSIPNSGCFGRF